jgi:hypothetical protein
MAGRKEAMLMELEAIKLWCERNPPKRTDSAKIKTLLLAAKFEWLSF